MTLIVRMALAVSLALAAAPALAEPVAVVVNRDNPRSDLSIEELRSVFLGRRTEWPDGTRVVPVDQAPSAPGRAAFLQAVLRMTAARFAEQWVDQQVRGAGSAPVVASSPAAAVRYVAKTRGAVAFVPLSVVTPAVKVISVGGKVPGEPGYAIP